MHGVIHLALRRFLEALYGPEGWLRLLERAGVPTSLPYVRLWPYPDEEMHAIIAAASKESGADVETILEEFGGAIAPDLIAMFPRLIQRRWRTLDLLLHTEQVIHRVVRQRKPTAQPPQLSCVRSDEAEVVVTYASPRRLCSLAQGIIRGVARHFGEAVTIVHAGCMRRGDPVCTLSVRLQQPGA